VRTGASNRIARLLHRFSTIQQAQSFTGGDQLQQAMTGGGVDLAAYRIELAVEA
jgi:hypothetical protein